MRSRNLFVAVGDIVEGCVEPGMSVVVDLGNIKVGTSVSSVEVIDVSSEAVIEAYARIDHESRELGRRMGKNDLWIAAVASVLTAVVVTTDQDFDHLTPGLVRVECVDVESLLKRKP